MFLIQEISLKSANKKNQFDIITDICLYKKALESEYIADGYGHGEKKK